MSEMSTSLHNPLDILNEIDSLRQVRAIFVTKTFFQDAEKLNKTTTIMPNRSLFGIPISPISTSLIQRLGRTYFSLLDAVSHGENTHNHSNLEAVSF